MTSVQQEKVEVTDLEAQVNADADGEVGSPPGTVEKVEEPRESEKIALVPATKVGTALTRQPSSAMHSMLSPSVERVLQKKQAEEEMLKKAFAQLDEDGSGTLDKKEVKKMAKILGDNLKTEQLHNAFAQMDRMNAGEVTFNQFKKWWFMKKDDELKAARKKAREIFNEIDADGGGTLDVDEVAKMQKLLQKRFPKIELEPPFDLQRDFEEMDRSKTGEVTFAEFEFWWRSRTGDDEPDIPVLPESMVAKVNDISAANKALGTLPTDRKRTGAELWTYLRPRLFLLVEMSKRWGSIHALYPTATSGSIFEEKPLPRWVRNPDSEFSTQWDIVQVFALLYVCYIVPMRASMEITTNIDSFAFWFDVFIDLYFIADLFLNFRTAFWDKRGTLEGDLVAIRKHYIGGGTELMGGYFPVGWFLIDFVSCLPVGYISVFAEMANPDADTSNSNFRAFKTLRLLRLAKLLRITRIKKILEKYEDQFDANQYLGLLFTVFSIVFMAHMMACFWYMVGKGEQIDGAGNLVQGWVHNPEGKGWSDSDLNPTCEPSNEDATTAQISACHTVSNKNSFGRDEDDDKAKCLAAGDCQYQPMVINYGTRYITAMFSSFDCSFAFTDAEHGFLMMSILITGFIYGALAGVISTLLMGLAAGDQEFTAKLQSLKAWMGARSLAKQDQRKILSYYKAANKGAKAFNEQEILDELPPSLGGDVCKALYGEVLSGLPIFRNLGEELMTHLCRTVHPMTALRSQIIMEQDKIGTEIYFITDGEVEVIQDDERLGFLGEGSFFGETPFLEALEGKGGSGKEVRSRTIRASVDTDLGFIKREDMLELVEEYPELQIRIRQFARTGLKLSKKAKSAADAHDILIHAIANQGAAVLNDKELEQQLQNAEEEVAAAQAKRDVLLAKKKEKVAGPKSYEEMIAIVDMQHKEREAQIRAMMMTMESMQKEMMADRELFTNSITALGKISEGR